jgi:hypothetical protein
MARQRRAYVASPELEVAGSTTLSFIDNISSTTFRPLIERHNLQAVDTTQWYPLQRIFDLFNDIAEQNGTQPFVAMGMKIAQQSEFPPEMLGHELSLVEVLNGWQAHYEANHRGGDLPPVETIKVDDTHYQLILQPDHLYPYDLVYGMAYGFCRLLLPKGSSFKVAYADGHHPHLDMSGDDHVIINVSW